MICSALDVATGSPVEITFDKIITQVTAAKEEPELYIAPGFIDLQVNGFAGVDYNSPETPLEEIARSVRVIQATGVSRFYATVITGAPDDMTGALRNLARAKEQSPSIEAFHVEGPHIAPEDGPR